MAKIQSGASTDEMSVDPTSKAARVTLYDSLGREINPQKNNKYFLPILIDVTAIQAANSYIWMMRNDVTKKITFNNITLNCCFHGSATTISQLFELVRFSGANPSGGTAIAIGANVPRKNSGVSAHSTIQDARFNNAAALTIGGISFEPNGIASFGVPRSPAGQQFVFDFSKLDIELGAGEGLAIRATAATVVGDIVQGVVHWTEE